ncbi:unnamed protein product [Rotaria magnacalcarata]|uniref:Uncharacterized protein n=1 Tax=Rotaria magnacalcarata TaxID=392030 RepID=A0A816NWX8_9BILA|nr:unnamed protein product [Rotaria magnacalcarata]
MILITCYAMYQEQTTKIYRNDEQATGICYTYGDFHVHSFPQSPGQARPAWWCKGEGEHLIYENEWIRWTITVTKTLVLTEKYKIALMDCSEIMCMITNDQNICNHPKIKLKNQGSVTIIDYVAASLRIVIVRSNTAPYYDIALYQTNFNIIRRSIGLCIVAPINCELEQPAIYRNQNPKLNQLDITNSTLAQLVAIKHAEHICNHYFHSARQLATQLGLTAVSRNTEDILVASCTTNLESTGDKRLAKRIIETLLMDTFANFDRNDDQKLKSFEMMLSTLEVILEKCLNTFDKLNLGYLINDSFQSDSTLETDVSQGTPVYITEQLPRKTSSSNNKDKGICHFYGDPHIIVFPQRAEAFQHQFWCKTSGEHQILKNDFVQITAIIQNQTWSIDEFIITFFENNTTICTITNSKHVCNSSEIRTIHTSLKQIDILYTTPQLHISIVTHQLQLHWYDINVRMPFELIRQSSGLCVMPPVNECELENIIEESENPINPLSRQICEKYLSASNRASSQLDLSNYSERSHNAFVACIHDYETTGNLNFGASIISMMVKYGINQQQLDNLQFESQTNKSIEIIDSEVINASIDIDILLSTTTDETTTSIEPVTTIRISSTGTTRLSSLDSTTVANSLTTVKSNRTLLRFLSFLLLIQFFLFI